MFSPVEMLLIVFVAVLLFGVQKLPVWCRGFAGGLRAFRDELQDNGGESEHAQQRS